MPTGKLFMRVVYMCKGRCAFRIIPLAYGALLLCLALFKGIEYWRMDGLRNSELVLVIIKDQVFYYLV